MQQPTTPAPTMPTEWNTATIVILALIAIGILLTLLAILRGAKLRRERAEASRIEAERLEAEAPAPIPAPPAPPVAEDVPPPAEPPIPLPVAPLPPPLDTAPISAGDEAPTLADAPIAAAAPLDASPASEAAAPPQDQPSPETRPLTLIKGLGPRVANRLGELGIANVGDLARLRDDEAEALDARLGPFTGRMSRDRWLEQARFLAAGDDKGFEAVFGRL